MDRALDSAVNTRHYATYCQYPSSIHGRFPEAPATLLALVAYCSLVLAFVFRGGLTIRLFGLAVVDAAGAEVTRWRALLRAAVAWMPLIGLQLVAAHGTMALVVRPAA